MLECGWVMGWAPLDGVVKKGLSEGSLIMRERVMWKVGKSVSGQGNHKCQHPEVGTSSVL